MPSAALDRDVSLSDTDKEYIRKIILPKVNSDTLAELFEQIEYWLETHAVEGPPMTASQERRKLKSIEKDLNKALVKLSLLSRAGTPSILDDYYFIDNDDDYLLKLNDDPNSATGIEENLERLISAIDRYHEVLGAQTKNGRPLATRYAFLITTLMDFFALRVPEYTISADLNGKIGELVSYIFTLLPEFQKRKSKSPPDPSRHLEYAFACWEKRGGNTKSSTDTKPIQNN